MAVVIGAVVRLQFIVRTQSVIDADEAIVGLMAKHILEGYPIPTFYYGQPYMGSFEALGVAVMFYFFDLSNLTLKLMPFVCSLVFICLVYIFSRKFSSRLGASVAVLFAAVPPSALVQWSTKTRGGFIEIVVIGTCALIYAVDLLKARRVERYQFLVLGLILGFGWWVNNQIVYYMLAIGLAFFAHFIRLYDWMESIRFFILGVIGFFIGGCPFWAYNVLQVPRFQSFEVLSQGATIEEMVIHGYALFEEALPILLGARRMWSTEDIFPGATLLVFIIYGTVLATIVINWLWASDGLLQPANQYAPTRRPFVLMLVFLLMLMLVFCSSRFGWLTKEPRYLFPIYSVLFVIVGQAVSSFFRSKHWGTRALGFAVVALITVVNLASNYAYGGYVPGQPFVFDGGRVSVDHQPLYRWLKEQGYDHVRTNYWIGYRIAFETEEEVTFSRYRGPKTMRVPRYQQEGAENQAYPVFVLVPEEARLVREGFSKLGRVFRSSEVSGYVVIDQVRPVTPRGTPLALSGQDITASQRPKNVRNLVDGDVGTRWGSGEPQRPGMEILVHFNEPVEISGLDLDLGYWPHDFPRGLVVELLDDAGQWCRLLETGADQAIDYVLEGERRWELNFVPQTAQALRLTQIGWDLQMDWSLAEITVFQPLAQPVVQPAGNWQEQY